MSSSPSKSILQSQSVLSELRHRIAVGKLTAGEKLRASHLAMELEASRTPIAEAMVKLEFEGLLVRDKSGYTVRQFAKTDVYDAIELRGLLEAEAAQRCAERGLNPSAEQELNALLHSMDALIDKANFQAYEHANDAFHLCLLEACQSTILIDEVKRSYRLPFAGPSAFPINGSERFRESVRMGHLQHRQIIDAISKRQGARAFSLLRGHARLAHQNVEEAMARKEKIPQLALVAT